MWVLPHYVSETLANALYSQMCATDKLFYIAALVRNFHNGPRKHLRSYLDVINYLLHKFATDQAIAKFDDTTVLYMQPANMIAQQYADD